MILKSKIKSIEDHIANKINKEIIKTVIIREIWRDKINKNVYVGKIFLNPVGSNAVIKKNVEGQVGTISNAQGSIPKMSRI